MKLFVLTILLVGLISGIFSGWISSLWDGQEDSYITYSYAKHIAQGKGFVASVGSKPSLGTTTPLFTLLLAAFAYIGVEPHIASMWIGAFCHAVIAMLMVLLARRFMNPWLALASGIFWAFSLAIFFRIGGMETPIQIVLLVSLALSEIHSLASKSSAVILALLLFCRPDSVLIFVSVLAFWIFNDSCRTRVLRNLLIITLITLPWVIYALQTFGSIIPSSLVSKFTVHVSWTVNLNTFLNDYFPSVILPPFIVAIFILGSINLWRESYEFRPFLVWIPLYYVSFWAGRAPDFAWYYVPPLVFIPMIFIRGLLTLTNRIPSAFKSAAMSICILISLGIWLYANLICTYGLRATAHSVPVHKRLALYMRENANEQDLIAAKEVGMLSYYSKSRVVDLLGLTSPEVLKWSMRHDFEGIIRHYQPRFVIVGDMNVSGLGYHEIKRFPYLQGYYLIYERNQPLTRRLE